MKLTFDLSKLKKCSDQNLMKSYVRLRELLKVTETEIHKRKGNRR